MNRRNDFTVVPFPQIRPRYGLTLQDYAAGVYFDNIPDDTSVYQDPTLNTFAVYSGDTRLDALDLTLLGMGLARPEHRAVLVIGDLHVDGGIDMYGTDVGYPMTLYVSGHLHAGGIAISQLAEIIVRGDLRVGGTLLAQDASTGKILCCGDLQAGAIFQERFPLKVLGQLSTKALAYVASPASTDADDTTLAGIHSRTLHAERLLPCIEDGYIGLFDELRALERGELDWDTLDPAEAEHIEALHTAHCVLHEDCTDSAGDGTDLRARVLAGLPILRDR